MLLLCRVLLASRFGRVLRATRENPMRVQAVGLAPYPFRLLAYGIAGGIGGLAGALLAQSTEFVAPSYLAWQRSGDLLFMVILGGLGSPLGAVLGALALVLLEEWLGHLTEHWRLILGTAADPRRAVPARRPGRAAGAARRPRARRWLSRCSACDGLRKRFGGLAVTDDVSLDVAPRRDPCRHRPERRRQDHADPRDQRRAAPR